MSQLEAGSGNPTLETLYALANELGVALADLIADPQPSSAPRVVRRGRGPRTQGAAVEAHLLFRQLGTTGTVELYAVYLENDSVQRSAAHPPGTREHLHVHRGCVTVGPSDELLELETGDYADYPADTEHVYQRHGHDVAEVTLMIVTPAHTLAGR